MRKRLPAGDDFLPNISIDTLKTMIRKERNVTTLKRLEVYTSRKQGLTITEIAERHYRPYSTVRDWLHMCKDNLDRLHDDEQPRHPGKLSPEQLLELRRDILLSPKAHNFTTNSWTGKLLARHVKNKYGIEYVPRHMPILMHEMGFGVRVSRPKHPKSASPETPTFQERTYEKEIRGSRL